MKTNRLIAAGFLGVVIIALAVLTGRVGTLIGIVFLVAAFGAGAFFLLRAVQPVVPDGCVGVVTKHRTPLKMTATEHQQPDWLKHSRIRVDGSDGVQASILREGQTAPWPPLIYSVRMEPITVVEHGLVGLVVASDGAEHVNYQDRPSFTGNDLQDAAHFLVRGGGKGYQPYAIPEGSYNLNPDLFEIISIPVSKRNLRFDTSERGPMAYDKGLGPIVIPARDGVDVTISLGVEIQVVDPVTFGHVYGASQEKARREEAHAKRSTAAERLNAVVPRPPHQPPPPHQPTTPRLPRPGDIDEQRDDDLFRTLIGREVQKFITDTYERLVLSHESAEEVRANITSLTDSVSKLLSADLADKGITVGKVTASAEVERSLTGISAEAARERKRVELEQARTEVAEEAEKTARYQARADTALLREQEAAWLEARINTLGRDWAEDHLRTETIMSGIPDNYVDLWGGLIPAVLAAVTGGKLSLGQVTQALEHGRTQAGDQNPPGDGPRTT